MYASGLTNVTDLAFHGRTLYAVQLDDDNFFDGHLGSVREIAFLTDAGTSVEGEGFALGAAVLALAMCLPPAASRAL